MLRVFAHALLSTDADAACRAPFGACSPDRVNRHNGYRKRPWDTRVGTIALAIPKLRAALVAVMLGPSCQRCSTHFMSNLLTKAPKTAQHFVATVVRSIFAQPDAEAVREQHRHVID
jgi:transposase-like protein